MAKNIREQNGVIWFRMRAMYWDGNHPKTEWFPSSYTSMGELFYQQRQHGGLLVRGTEPYNGLHWYLFYPQMSPVPPSTPVVNVLGEKGEESRLHWVGTIGDRGEVSLQAPRSLVSPTIVDSLCISTASTLVTSDGRVFTGVGLFDSEAAQNDFLEGLSKAKMAQE